MTGFNSNLEAVNNKASGPESAGSDVGVIEDRTFPDQLEASREEFPEYEPYVRYGFPEESDNPRQSPRLHHLTENPPEEAITVSPVYHLTDEQISRNDGGKSPFAVSTGSIGSVLQNECEEAGRVLYPIYVESDEASDCGLHPTREALKELVADVFEIDPEEASWWYSGGRSIHAHLPSYVTTEQGLVRIKDAVEEFNEKSDIKADPAIYSRKRLFRIPGVEHEDTGRQKIRIPVTSDAQELRKLAMSSVDGREEEDTYTARAPSRASKLAVFDGVRNTPYIKENSTPLIEQREKPEDQSDCELWNRYNRHHFSPYANADQNRSVALFRVKGGPFARHDDERVKIPAYVYAAVGGDGEFSVAHENCPIYLSKTDFEKWDFVEGDTVVMIGTANGQSRMFQVGYEEHEMVVGAIFHDIHRPDNGRLSIELLADYDYEVGERGTIQSNYGRTGGTGDSDAAALQRQAEQEGPESLSHYERRDLANRLLQIHGWDGAWNWFKEQYGDDFDPETTYRNLKSLVDEYDDLDHVEVPAKSVL